MIGIGGSQVVLTVAIDTFHTQRLKLEVRNRSMTVGTISSIVCSQQGKSTALMQLRDVGNQPRFWGVASGTIHPNRCIVHIGVAIHTVGLRLRKNQRSMARFAVSSLMFAFEPEGSLIVIKFCC